MGGNNRIGKRKEKNSEKDNWELPDVIPLMPIVWVNYRLPIYICRKEWYIFILHKRIFINL